MIVGSEIEIEITKVIGEADQGPENNTEMRKGIYTINEKQEYQNLCIMTICIVIQLLSFSPFCCFVGSSVFHDLSLILILLI